MKCDIHLPEDYLHILAVGKIHQITTIPTLAPTSTKHLVTHPTNFQLNTNPLFGITFVGAIHYHIKDHFKKSTTLHFQTPQNFSTSPPPQKKKASTKAHSHFKVGFPKVFRVTTAGGWFTLPPFAAMMAQAKQVGGRPSSWTIWGGDHLFVGVNMVTQYDMTWPISFCGHFTLVTFVPHLSGEGC